MGTQEEVAQGRNSRAETLRAAAAKMRVICKRLQKPKDVAEIEDQAKKLEEMAARIEFNEVHDHARGKA